MPFVYIDMIKHAVPAGIREFVGDHSAQYIVFGSYDLLYYAIPDAQNGQSLSWLEKQHEKRHDLDWNYERHPLCLYCPDGQSDRLRRLIDPAAHVTHPLVLTMARMVKHPLLESEPCLELVLDSLQGHIHSLLEGHADIELVVCWNLGNADFVLISRPRTLSPLRDLFLMLENNTFEVDCGKDRPVIITKFCSFSSYCAFPIYEDSSLCANEDDLRTWLNRDGTLRFINTVDWLPSPQGDGKSYRTSRFLFGDRDFQYPDGTSPDSDAGPSADPDAAPGTDSESKAPIDSILRTLKEMLDPGHKPSILSSSLVPSLPMTGTPSPSQSNNTSSVSTYSMDWEKIHAPMYRVDAAITSMGEVAEYELDALGCSERVKRRHTDQLTHCKNTLFSLYWHAMRLYAAAYQDDVLMVVLRLYDALADTIDAYRRYIEVQKEQGGEGEFTRAIPDLYLRIMRFVSELQHVYTVLAISPHSYMETYYGSMRSLNASSKLWVCYNGVIRAVCDLFPLHNDYEGQGCSVLLVPYREKRSKSRQIFPALNTSNMVVLLQLNYPMMFHAKWTLFVIAHELGHYLFNTTRCMRRDLLLRYVVAGVIINNRLGDALKRPLFTLTAAMYLDDKLGEQELQEYEVCLADDARAREWVRLNAYADLDNQTYIRLYNDMNAALAKRYASVVERVTARYAQKFYEPGEPGEGTGCSVDEPGASEDYGRDVVKDIRSYVRSNTEDIIEEVARGINDESVAFLQGIDAYESKYAVEFDLYALAGTKAYWTMRQEGGRGGKAVVQNAAGQFVSWCNTVLDVFRETHADVFACKVIGYTCDDYLEHVSRFADSSPELITTYRDLVRIMVVCETALGDKGCSRLAKWVEDDDNCLYTIAERREARAMIHAMREEPHYRYLLEYGKVVAKSVDERIARIRQGNKSELLDELRGFASSTGNTAQYLWRFWLYAMRRG